MAWVQGWWTLATEGFDLRDLSDSMRDHIAAKIREGNTEGQIFEEVFDECQDEWHADLPRTEIQCPTCQED
jgi:hypothetical protein